MTSKLDFQFAKCGSLNPGVNNPWVPCIQKPKAILSGIDKVVDNHIIMNQIDQTIISELDCPIEVIKEIESLKLSERRKSLYYRALYQCVPELLKDYSYTLGKMYNKYYYDVDLMGSGYSFSEKHFIKSCRNSNKLMVDIYKREYIKYSKW